jgi:cation diffusion facilitator CzcD-associated flavoprotein CzcO
MHDLRLRPVRHRRGLRRRARRTHVGGPWRPGRSGRRPYLGGTCVNVGCVPKKLFVYGSHFAEEFADAAAYGWDVGAERFDWPRLRDNKTREIERLNGIYRNLLRVPASRSSGAVPAARCPPGAGGRREFTAANVLVATGSWPSIPEVPGRELAITSNEAFYLEQFPERVVVVGGGYIAVEFAGIFAGLGAATTLIYRGPLFLRGFDDDVRRFVAAELARNTSTCASPPRSPPSKRTATSRRCASTTAARWIPTWCSTPPAGYPTPPGLASRPWVSR